MIQIGEELRKTPKGQLQYSRGIEGEQLKDLLETCSLLPKLSSFHKETPSPKSHLSSSFGLSPPPTTEDKDGIVNGHQQVATLNGNECDKASDCEKGEVDQNEKETLVISHIRSSSVASVHNTNGGRRKLTESKKSPDKDVYCVPPDHELEGYLTTQFNQRLRIIHDVEKNWDNKPKEFMQKKEEQFHRHEQELVSQQQEGLKAVSQHHLDNTLSQHSMLEQEHQSRKQEISQAVQKVKESHSEVQQRQDARMKELEKLSQQLKEEKERREHELEQKLVDIRSQAKSIGETKASLFSALDTCQHKQHLPDAADKAKLLMRKLAEQADQLAGSTDKNGPLQDIMHKLKHIQEQSHNLLDHVNSLIADAEEKAKAAEEAEKQKQSQQQQQQPQASQQQSASAGSGDGSAATAQPTSIGEEGALAAVFKEYDHNSKLLAQMETTLQPLVGDQQMKKLRFDLQRAVNTPVNAISPVSSAHLRDKLQRLRALLQGQTVEVAGKRVNPQDVKEGIMFCKNLTAKMIARKAEEQVSSSHESAFAIAAVAIGLWAEFPDVGQLLMCHLQALCPYVLPIMLPRLPQQSSAEYHKSLGYKVEEDGTIEPQDKYLRRMSGIMRLYAAILVTAPPQSASHPHPHGIEHAWIWLSRTLNLKPDPDITATAIFDMLQVTGQFLLRTYRVQFAKLLYCLYKQFMPKLKEVAAGSGPVSRLETFLETTMKNSCSIPVPEGYLSPPFWNT